MENKENAKFKDHKTKISKLIDNSRSFIVISDRGNYFNGYLPGLLSLLVMTIMKLREYGATDDMINETVRLSKLDTKGILKDLLNKLDKEKEPTEE